MTQEALKIALDALETELSIDWGNPDDFDTSAEKMHKAIAAIKEALAQPEQEPVAWARYPRYTGKAQLPEIVFNKPDGKDWLELYTTPPQRTWVGLFDEEIEVLFQTAAGADEEVHIRFARAIESKIKELNT